MQKRFRPHERSEAPEREQTSDDQALWTATAQANPTVAHELRAEPSDDKRSRIERLNPEANAGCVLRSRLRKRGW